MLKPIITATQHLLPFRQLSWKDFERLCLRLIHARRYTQIEHLGASGKDEGIDIKAMDGNTRVAVQCKNIKTFTATHGLIQVNKFLSLREKDRPQRIIFMVSCSISSATRKKIRIAWNEDESACEFLSETELDTEVRQHSSIVEDFFGLPRIATSETYQKLPQRYVEIGQGIDELRKVETTNREWVSAIGGSPFLRLLHSFEEIIYPTARLQLGRTLLDTINNIGARKRATGRELLQICFELESHQFFQLNWKLRRMLARVVGDIIGKRIGIGQSTIVCSFCDRIVESSKGIQFLAEAATEHTAAAKTIGKDRLRALLFSTNPQARWQLLRRWPIVSPVISEGIDLEDIMEDTDVGIKRMLILTRLQLYRSSNKYLKNLLGRLKEDLHGKDPEGADFRFYNAVMVWVSYYTAFENPIAKAQAAEIANIDDAIELKNWKMKKSEVIVEQLIQSLELDTIKRDLLNAEGNYIPHPKRFSEGRYGYTRYYVNRIINELPIDLLTELLFKMLNCADEGIRWAVAAEVLNWWRRIHDYEQSKNIIIHLLRDDHPWVVREALQQLSKDPYISQAIGVNLITQYADESSDKARKRGWEISELNSAKMRIAAQSFAL